MDSVVANFATTAADGKVYQVKYQIILCLYFIVNRAAIWL